MTGRYPTRFGFEFTPAPKAFMRLDRAACAATSPRAADLLRGAREGRAADRGAGPAARGDHDRGAPARARLPHARARQVAPRRGAARCSPTRRASTSILGFLPGASMFLPPDDPASVNSVQDFDPIDRVPVGEPRVRGAQGRRPALRAERLHDRLPRRRGGARDRGEPRTARSSCTSRSTRRTRRCRR